MYLVLIGQDGKELKGKGYHRVCLDRIHWALAPPERQDDEATFHNLDMIEFPAATDNWGECRPAIVGEDDQKIFHMLECVPRQVPSKSKASFERGRLRLGISWR